MYNDPVAPPPGASYHGAPGRSRVPRIMGILMLTFGGLGLLWTLGMVSEGPRSLMSGYWLVLQLAVSAVHLTAGALALRHHPVAPLVASIYGATTFLAGIAVLPPICQPLPEAPAGASPFMHGLDYMLTVLAIYAQLFCRVMWAVLVVVLMNTAAARRTCRTTDNGGIAHR